MNKFYGYDDYDYIMMIMICPHVQIGALAFRPKQISAAH